MFSRRWHAALMPQDRTRTAVVCDDRADVRRSVTGVLERCGFVVVGEADDFAALCRLVEEHRPGVAVLSLPVIGVSSLAAVGAVRSAEPGCQVVVLSAFEQLHLAALEAGAAALVAESDPQALQAVLRTIAGGRVPRSPPRPRTPGQVSGPTVLSATGLETALST